MSETKERSAVFKFFYITLRVITFPVFMVLYLLMHPLKALMLLVVLAGLAYGYPVTHGVSKEDLPAWYRDKATTVELGVMKMLHLGGKTGAFGQKLQADIEAEKRALEEEKEDARRVKGENFNASLVRGEVGEDMAKALKSRTGFKKKKSPTEEKAESEVDVLTNNAAPAGGLENVLKEQPQNETTKPVLPSVQKNAEQTEKTKSEAAQTSSEDEMDLF
jgi:hypothetical protein